MTGWFLENMIWASAAMLLVLLIRRPVAEMFGARAAYWLWAVPAARLVAPPAEWMPDLFTSPVPALAPLVVQLDLEGAGEGVAEAAAGIPWLTIVLLIWAAGALLFLVYQAVSYRTFLRSLSLSLRSAGDHRGVPLIESEAVTGPLALGLLDRRIVVPANFDVLYSRVERDLALEHERHHHRRGDILANHLALVVLAINWFNPVAWAAFRAFRADQELSCDAAVASGAAAEARADYAQALVKAAIKPGLIAACPLNSADQLKRRLRMLKSHRSSRLRSWGGGLTAGGLALAALALPAPAATHPHPEEEAGRTDSRSRVYILDRVGGSESGERRREDRELVVNMLRPGVAEHLERCRTNDDEVIPVDAGGGRRVMLMCARGEGPPAGRLEALRRLRERIGRVDNMTDEVRTRIIEQLDEEIGRARRD